jgi:hypothetical protein
MSKSLIGKLLVKVRTLNKGYVQVLHQDNLGLHAGTHFDHAACSYSVTQARHAFYLGAMLAAEEGAFLFESVTDNMNPAIPACRASAWIAHSKLSNVWVVPFMVTSNALS